MNNLVSNVEKLKKSDVSNIVNQRLNEFSNFENKPNEDWYSELCFCLLTANSRAKSAIVIQNNLGYEGFSSLSQETISKAIRLNKHRFHNNKAKFICESRKYQNIKEIIKKITKDKSEIEAREWLVENVKGLGYKEASHFLRNTGSKNIAILDRHILNLMVENKIISKKPKSLTKNIYLEIENKFNELADNLKMSPAELDIYMWYIKTGEVLK